MRLKTSVIAQVQDKDKIEGAYLLLKRFKQRLRAFDTALNAVNNAKVNMA